MNRLLATAILTVFSIVLSINSIAAEDKRQSGVETSAEHKSEEGLEHGEAYAGSKEKKIRDEKEEKVKKEKSGKEEKVKNEKEEKEEKLKKEKKEKKEK